MWELRNLETCVRGFSREGKTKQVLDSNTSTKTATLQNTVTCIEAKTDRQTKQT